MPILGFAPVGSVSLNTSGIPRSKPLTQVAVATGLSAWSFALTPSSKGQSYATAVFEDGRQTLTPHASLDLPFLPLFFFSSLFLVSLFN